ncbi:MAG TPA: hypothetical protein VLX28_01145 [Thermoanaerobaculia bacterium]|nr:hypothetical protein [Thermoanaerobaculia bacterium]
MVSEQTQPSLSARRSLFVLFAFLLFCGAALSAQTVQVSPALPTTQDAIVLQASLACNPVNPPTIVGQTITLTITVPLQPCNAGPFVPLSFPLPPLPAESYTVRWIVDGTPLPETTVFQVTSPNTSLHLQNSRFLVTATFTNPLTGAQETAQAVQLSDESGYFWFFGSTNTELSLKILNGQIINGHSWIFLASMTTVGFSMKVTDLQTPSGCAFAGDTSSCFSKTYTSPAGTNQNFFDLQTFTGTTP